MRVLEIVFRCSTRPLLTCLLGSLSTAFLLFISSSAEADWMLLSKSTSGAEFYVEKETIMDLGDQVYIKNLVNYPNRQDTGELSSISDTVVVCSRLMMKDTRLKTYDGKSGSGTLLSDHDLVRYELDFWRTPPRGSAEQLFLIDLCGLLRK